MCDESIEVCGFKGGGSGGEPWATPWLYREQAARNSSMPFTVHKVYYKRYLWDFYSFVFM